MIGKFDIGKRAATLLLAAACFVLLIAATGCGGGGGGGAAPATVVGRILLVSTGGTLTGATVSINGVSFTTLADGVFTLNNVPSTATQLTVTGTGIKPLTQTLDPLTPNKTNDLGDIFVLNSTDAGTYTANIKSAVVSNTLAPIAGAKVKIGGHITTTDANGNFTISGLPTGLNAGAGIIGKITAAGFEDKPVVLDVFDLVAGDNVITPPYQLTLPVSGTPPPPANISGKISLQGQTDLSGTTVTLINKSTGQTVSIPQLTSTSGNYGFYVAAGTYTVKAEHAGSPAFQTKTADVTLTRPDRPQTVNLTLVP